MIGRLTATAKKSDQESESQAADLIADSMLAATKSDAQLALVNSTGVRVDLPGGDVRYKDAFAMMPFGNNLVVLTLTGAQLKAVLEQQYAIPLAAQKRPCRRCSPRRRGSLTLSTCASRSMAESPTCD